MYECKIDNNGNLDLALSNDNEYKTCFDKTSESKIMLTTVKPNLMCQFRIQNSGDNLPDKHGSNFYQGLAQDLVMKMDLGEFPFLFLNESLQTHSIFHKDELF